MARDRAILLGEPELIENRDGDTVNMRRLPEDRADRHNAGAADAGDQKVISFRDIRQLRWRKIDKVD